jgi:hypothetical protein
LKTYYRPNYSLLAFFTIVALISLYLYSKKESKILAEYEVRAHSLLKGEGVEFTINELELYHPAMKQLRQDGKITFEQEQLLRKNTKTFVRLDQPTEQ